MKRLFEGKKHSSRGRVSVGSGSDPYLRIWSQKGMRTTIVSAFEANEFLWTSFQVEDS